MAKPLTLAQIEAAYRKWHVRYVVYPGAGTRGRPGGITDVSGELEHHTGGGSASSSYLYFLFVTGRPAEGIPGPLCNEATAADGTVYIGAVGRANHAGYGSSATLAHIVAEDYAGYTSELKPGPDGINGNPRLYGNEWIYSGTKPPLATQYRGAVLAAAARADAHGWTALSFAAHREHTRRKDDPFGVNMAQFRRDVRTVLAAGPNATVHYVATGKLAAQPTQPAQPPTTPPAHKPPATTPPEDDMPWTEVQLRAMMQAENEEYNIRFWVDPSGTGTALRKLVSKVSIQGDRIEAKLDELLGREPLQLNADGLNAQSVELHSALDKAVNQLSAAPMQAHLSTILNADGTMNPVDAGTDASEAPRE